MVTYFSKRIWYNEYYTEYSSIHLSPTWLVSIKDYSYVTYIFPQVRIKFVLYIYCTYVCMYYTVYKRMCIHPQSLYYLHIWTADSPTVITTVTSPATNTATTATADTSNNGISMQPSGGTDMVDDETGNNTVIYVCTYVY